MKKGLRHLVREEIEDDKGQVISWRLKVKATGEYVFAFDEYLRRISQLPFETRRTYMYAVSKFIDYLYAAEVLGHVPTLDHLNVAIDYYFTVLEKGTDALTKSLPTHVAQFPEDAWKLRMALNFNQHPYQPDSLGNKLTPVNDFLACQEKNSFMAWQIVRLHGIHVPSYDVIDPTGFYEPLIRSVSGSIVIPDRELRKIREKTILGAAAALAPSGIARPAGLRARVKKNSKDLERLDFPLAHLRALLDQATSWRNRAFWLALIAYGLRYSEALQLRWELVDFRNRRIWVPDPHKLRYGRCMNAYEVRRFKGRTVSRTVAIPYLRDEFFNALRMYFLHEHVSPPAPDGDHGFVFRYLREPRRGEPYFLADDSTIQEPFSNAVKQAMIPGPPGKPKHVWTLQSMRHAYGVYMRNLLPQPGGFGLETRDVQMLMGHAVSESTDHYAREEDWRRDMRLQYADMLALGASLDDIAEIPRLAAQRMLAEAEEMRALSDRMRK